ncbi:unnamed protein product [Protopolystoma xenopodis]|uniref:Uncharacterized protein n=1 Tax=Protopolystoma xenopodis TaxID=117903 RepID=A0A3S5CJU6_9PLAT|nr:unnamed protein product [Protopolystoma xenopodis]
MRNPHMPPLDPCELSASERVRVQELGYRLIPGNRCQGGWTPPRLKQAVVLLAKSCKPANVVSSHST